MMNGRNSVSSVKVLSITSGKGGVGKTTVAVNLAAGLATNLNINCALIDGDPIGSSSLWLNNTKINRLDLNRLVLPNSSHNIHHALQTWGASLANMAYEYDLVIADLPPIGLADPCKI